MMLLVAFVAGLAAWTFLEYAIHNWLGHVPKGRHEVSREHLRHHADTSYFSPWWKKLILAVPMVGGIWLVFGVLGGSMGASTLATGIVTGWLAYEWLHRHLHTHPPRNAFGRWARRHHFHHHFASPERNHGVSSPIWDHVFGTYESPTQIRVPEKQVHGLKWLVEPGTLSVRPEYAGAYVVITPSCRPAAVQG